MDAGTMEAPAPPPLPPKDHPVSRYRSLRGKSVSSPTRRNRTLQIYRDAHTPSPENDEEQQESPSVRAQARSATSASRNDGGAPIEGQQRQPLQPFIPTHYAGPLSPRSVNLPALPSPSLTYKAAIESGLKPPTEAELARLHQLSKRAAELNKNEAARRRFTTGIHDEEAAKWADEVARLEAETDRILAEQKKRDLARLQAQLANTPAKPKPKRPILGKLTFLTLTRSRKPNGPPSQPGTPKSFVSVDYFSPAQDCDSPPSPRSNAPSPRPRKMNFIEQGGGGIVPQTDAPKAAINSGERRVTVRYLSSTINLPVTTDTTPVDIIFSTANLVAHSLDPKTSVLVECYVVLGLERRVRRYEPIREVMNSWDRDQQCSLLILSYDSRPDDRDLYLESVPRTENAPSGFAFQMYTSSRPGKWIKRWVTLMDTGQMFAAKKPDAKAADKDSTVLCHLSDFDIYTPTLSETSRHLKPPKKHCYAIKSQQKTNAFPDGQNFVHFFSTDDDELAQRFRDLVHGWRSWYLANKKVDLTSKKETYAPTRMTKEGLTKSMSSTRKAPQLHQTSVEEAPYLIGDFQPLLDMKTFDKPLEEFGKTLPVAAAPPVEQPNPKLRKSKSRPMLSTKVPKIPLPKLPDPFEKREFSLGGLLGKSYDKRKKEKLESPPPASKADGPFTQSPSLLNFGIKSPISPTAKSDSQSWFPSASEHSSRSRSLTGGSTKRPTTSSSRRDKTQQPLMNMSKEFPAPPARQPSRGRALKAPSGAPLIDYATGGTAAGSSRSLGGISSSGSAQSMARPRSRSGPLLNIRKNTIDGAPPVPALPTQGIRRHETMPNVGDAHRGRDRKPREPLINRVK